MQKQRHHVVTFQIAASFTLSPPPELVGELQWPAHPKPYTSSTFSVVGLFEAASVQPTYETQCQAG